MTNEQFHNAVKAGTIQAGTYTDPTNGHRVDVSFDGEGWVRSEYLAPIPEEDVQATERFRRCQADADYPVLIIARFRTKGTDNDCSYQFNSQDALDEFSARYERDLELQDAEYLKALYFLGPQMRITPNYNL